MEKHPQLQPKTKSKQQLKIQLNSLKAEKNQNFKQTLERLRLLASEYYKSKTASKSTAKQRLKTSSKNTSHMVQAQQMCNSINSKATKVQNTNQTHLLDSNRKLRTPTKQPPIKKKTLTLTKYRAQPDLKLRIRLKVPCVTDSLMQPQTPKNETKKRNPT